jgi:hypothetical protein
MNAKRTVLQVPKPAPVRGVSGKFEQGKGDRLLEAHRQEKARAESESRRKP